MKWKKIVGWIDFLVRLPFMEVYCRIRYRCSWKTRLDQEIEEFITMMHVVDEE